MNHLAQVDLSIYKCPAKVFSRTFLCIVSLEVKSFHPGPKSEGPGRFSVVENLKRGRKNGAKGYKGEERLKSTSSKF